jgi:hypothetical protein
MLPRAQNKIYDKEKLDLAEIFEVFSIYPVDTEYKKSVQRDPLKRKLISAFVEAYCIDPTFFE